MIVVILMMELALEENQRIKFLIAINAIFIFFQFFLQAELRFQFF